ncbi:MAG: T9SS type A sorting domain-containing protein [Saprospiraceae bacterium]|nr:T9SS type A sorting domain-containing protein [Saprospiraceae bacterium]
MKNQSNFLLAVLCCLFLFLNTRLDAQWQVFTPPQSDTVGAYDVRMAYDNDQVVWCIAMKYEVTPTAYQWLEAPSLYFTKTDDGGATWTSGAIPMGVAPYASNICPLSGDVAWASGLDEDFVSYILKTTDGGLTWEPYLENAFTDPSAYVDFVHFWDENNGIVVGDPTPSDTEPEPFFEIYRTTDGGATWERVPSANIPPADGEFGDGGNYEVHGDHVWFNTLSSTNYLSQRIYHSADRGQTWEALETGNQFAFWSFSDSLHGVTAFRTVPGQPQVELRYTDDGGDTWSILPTYNSINPASDYILIPESHYILTARRVSNINGPFYTYVSKDLGVSWQQVSSGENVSIFDFSSPSTGYGAEWQPADHLMRMYKYAGDPLSGLLANQPLNAQVSVSPNPTADAVSVSISGEHPERYTVLLNNANGDLIYRQNTDKTVQASLRFELTTLPAGTYTVTVSSPAGHLTKTIVKL